MLGARMGARGSHATPFSFLSTLFQQMGALAMWAAQGEVPGRGHEPTTREKVPGGTNGCFSSAGWAGEITEVASVVMRASFLMAEDCTAGTGTTEESWSLVSRSAEAARSVRAARSARRTRRAATRLRRRAARRARRNARWARRRSGRDVFEGRAEGVGLCDLARRRPARQRSAVFETGASSFGAAAIMAATIATELMKVLVIASLDGRFWTGFVRRCLVRSWRYGFYSLRER